MKLTLAHLLLSYDCELEPYSGSRSFHWRSAILPRSSLKINMKNKDSRPKKRPDNHRIQTHDCCFETVYSRMESM